MTTLYTCRNCGTQHETRSSHGPDRCQNCSSLTPPTYQPPGWMASALCAQADPDAWYPDKGDNIRAAKELCRRCPVRVPCLELALERTEPHGLWGGLTPRERRKIRRGAA